MIHLRNDNQAGNAKRTFVCGIGPALPPGDLWLYEHEASADRADCPGCNPNPRRIGTPISELSGRPGHPGYDQFKAIAESWGYD